MLVRDQDRNYKSDNIQLIESLKRIDLLLISFENAHFKKDENIMQVPALKKTWLEYKKLAQDRMAIIELYGL